MAATGEDVRDTVTFHLSQPRYEIFPSDGVEDEVAEHVPTEVKITVTASPRRGMEATLALAEELGRRGYHVAPHISARLVQDEGHLREILDRLLEADLRDVFVVAGDLSEPTGAFTGAFDVLSTMARLGVRPEHVGITGYPESHPLISDETTIQAMFDKAPFATYIVSQVCFEPRTIAWWIRAVRERGVDLPIDIGIPGVAARTKLLRIARRIGVGESVRFLSKRRSWLAQIVKPAGYNPDHIVNGLGSALVDPAAGVSGFHVYTFNEIAATEAWRRRRLAQLSNGR
ncbi:MAG: methylenetetrahydrofolate reductase [Thermoleophilia bacterium]|nr:methylenetetrahydrofolate reductase [Thermoleophilia bacterium]